MKRLNKALDPRVGRAVLSSSDCLTPKRSYCKIAFLSLILFFFLNASLFAADYQAPKPALRGSPQVSTGNAGDEVGSGELYALVVGVSRYKDPKIPQLKVADKDARDFADFLKTQTQLFRTLHVTLLQNEQATRSEVEKHLYYKLRKAGKDDTVVLFLSGHGADDPNTPGEFFFLTHDAEPDYLAATAVHMNRQWFLSKLDSRRVVLIADACHAGGFSTPGVKSLEPAFQNFMQQFKESEGKVFLTSSRPDESSMEKPGMTNSVFTYYLIQGLKGEADENQDGVVTLRELYDYVYKKTKDETKGYQRPQMEGRIVGAFPMALDDSFTLMKDLWKTYGEKIIYLTNLLNKNNAAAGAELEQVYSDDRAAKWIRLAAARGIAEAQFNFGRMYDKGIGVRSDQVEAVKWYRKAADYGIPAAQTSLGLCYQEGRGLLQDHSKAAQWYRKAADQGNASAENNLGVCLEKGLGMPQNPSEAVKLYRKAADQGNPDAQNNLGNAYFSGKGISKDPTKAMEYWVKAVEKGHAAAKQNLVRHFGEGISGSRSQEMKVYETELSRMKEELDKLKKEQGKSDDLVRMKAELEKFKKEQDKSEELTRIKAELEKIKKEQSKPRQEGTKADASKPRPSAQREGASQPLESVSQSRPSQKSDTDSFREELARTRASEINAGGRRLGPQLRNESYGNPWGTRRE